MFNPQLLPIVGETIRELLHNSRTLLHLSQQQSTGVGTDIATIEMSNHFPVT
jgi:hypothetical protein